MTILAELFAKTGCEKAVLGSHADLGAYQKDDECSEKQP
jgi:hypothetical protein